MPFSLPSQDQIAAVIGMPGITMANQAQQGYDQAALAGRKTAAYNALRNIYGDVAGDPQAFSQLMTGLNTQATTNRTNTLLPGEVAQQGATLAHTNASTANTNANTNLTIGETPGKVNLATGTGQSALAGGAENIFQEQSAALQRGAMLSAAAAQNGGDPGAVWESPEAVRSIGAEKSAAMAQAARAHPDNLPSMVQELQQGRSVMPMISGKGAGQVHVSKIVTDANGQMYTVMSNGLTTPVAPGAAQQLSTQLGVPITPLASGGAPGQQAAAQPGAMVSGTFAQKTPGYVGAVEAAKKTGAAQGEKAASDLAPSQNETAAALNQGGATFAMFDAHETALKTAMQQADSAGAWSVTKFIPDTAAANAAATLKTAAGDMLLQQINNLKEGGKNGGTGVGRIMQAEIPLFANAYANLEQDQSPAQLKQNLQKAMDIIQGARSRMATYYGAHYGVDVPADMSGPNAALTQRQPTAGDVAYLRSHPDAKARFEGHYGIGSAARVLGQ
jgi:hypothetical protein